MDRQPGARAIDYHTGVVNTTASWCVENLAPPTCVSPGTIVADTSGGSTVNYCSATAIDANSDGMIDALDCTAPMVFDGATSTCLNAINNTCVGTLPQMVGPTSDTRTIYTANSAGTLIPFDTAMHGQSRQFFRRPHQRTDPMVFADSGAANGGGGRQPDQLPARPERLREQPHQ